HLNLEKLIGWKGGSLDVSGLDRNGTSLSEQYIGNQYTVQQIFGGETIMFYALIFQQKLYNDKIDIKIGRFATGDDFASSPLYWLYMNNGIDGNPQALPVNTAFSAYPWAVWAARLKVQPTEDTVAMFGVYQASNRIFKRAYHGMDWSMRPSDGVLLITQMGWHPELFKQAVPNNSIANTSKDATKAVKEPIMQGYPGHYWMGFYFSPWTQSTFTTPSSTAHNAYGFYWHADQMVYRPKLGLDSGLTVWSAITLSPQQNLAKIPYQINGGLIYKGLIPGRQQDQTIFGVIYGSFGSDYAQTVSPSGGGYPSYELDFEFGYRINFSKFLYVQPDIQYVINPGGTGNIPNALVLGSQMGVTF
ncbi:MAG: carbohydrate porin, partial [Chthoniobacterales bacterium]